MPEISANTRTPLPGTPLLLSPGTQLKRQLILKVNICSCILVALSKGWSSSCFQRVD